MSRLWGWIAAAFAALGAALIYVSGQRDRAREATEVARAQTKSVDAARDKESEIRKSVAEAHNEANRIEEQIAQRQAIGDRGKYFGDPRNDAVGLHGDSDSDGNA